MGIINRDRRAENYQRLQTARNRYSQAVDASIERRERRRAAEAKARQEAALRQQEIDAQTARDKRQHMYGQADNVQRANLASGAAAQDNRYTTERDNRQLKGTLKRDDLQNRATSLRDAQLAAEQARQDARRFGYSTLENEQQFGQQMQRDAVQHGYSTERDQLQFGNTLKRDQFQFGLDTQREDQQQRNTLERDYVQSDIQAERDNRLNQFDIQGDERNQGYTQQNMYQREAADIAARWQDQVAQAKTAGLDFSAQQRKEMQDLDATFRKNVINDPYLGEDLKQQAMVEHQRKLAAIIPNERVQKPQDQLGQSLLFDDRVPGVPFMMRQDANGPPTFEPLGIGQDPMMKAQQQAEEKKAAELMKAEDEREDKFQDLVNQMEVKLNPLTDEPLYKTREEAVKAAMDVFAPREKIYRRKGLQPLWAFQTEADEERAKLEKMQMVTPPPSEPVNPYMDPPASGMGESTRIRSGDPAQAPADSQNPSQPPVISHNGELPADVSKFMLTVPGGDQLMKLRKKHSSNAVNDQTMRMAVKVVINHLMTGDTSDPDLAEALDYVKRAGVQLGQ